MPEQSSQASKVPAAAQDAVIFVHAEDARAATPAWVRKLAALGLPLYSHRALKGCRTTQAGYRQLGKLLGELRQHAGGKTVLLLRAGLDPDSDALAELLEQTAAADGLVARSALSNALASMNPFAGLHGRPPADVTSLAQVVDALGPGFDHHCHAWPEHCVALSAHAVALLAQPDVTPANALSRLDSAGACPVVSDRHFVHDPGQALVRAPRLAAHEAPRPPSWGVLSARLQAWFEAGCPALPLGAHSAPATLHVTHSWGGGVAAWIGTFIAADDAQTQLQLRAEEVQSGQGFGQRLALYAGDQLACPLASWWLQPPIQSVEAANHAYRRVLDEIISRYRVSRVIVSSLVGHSLDALRSGVPTVQVLHDHFPLWPLLSVHPDRYRDRPGAPDLAAALANSGLPKEFGNHDAGGWKAISEQYQAAILEQGVALVAPSAAAATLFRELAPQCAQAHIEVIPHGVAPLPAGAAVKPRPRADGRLRLVIPGRIQPGKGQQLLLDALPRLRSFAQLYLLGAGQNGEVFFGQPGVHVIPQYRAGELPALLRGIGPDAAALLSLVPETFSYTLSEMQQLGVPVIATRVGSFPERIGHGKDGWLIDPNADALVRMVEVLHADPKLLQTARRQRSARAQDTPEDMVAAYRKLLAPAAAPQPPEPRTPDLAEAQAASLAQLGMLERARRLRVEASVHGLEKEIRQRTEWALDRDLALRQEQEAKRRWIAQLERAQQEQQQNYERWVQALERGLHEEQERNQRWVEQLNVEIAGLRQLIQEQEQQLKQAASDFEQLRTQHQQVLASSSWRLTRPLRVARRMAGNLMLSRAWNPLRWPLLLSGLVRNLGTVGWRGTVLRLQYTGPGGAPAEVPVDRLEAVGDLAPPASLPVSGEPEVSIVIPAYNNWAYTVACLRSIAETRNVARYEVLVVDDCSTDQTHALLQTVEGVTVLRNPENAGFIDSCNRGAAQSRGKYLVFLNNDTQVMDGWLDHLLQTFRQHPGAGLVGARLVYPDGRLQECGGMVFSDGSGWNYGRGGNPAQPEYMHLREADYCSGACFMIEAALFNELGGFDERYRPAYYEDTDLCFRVRAAGRQVLVQPASTVVHHEGITSGTDTDSGTKRFQSINREKFAARWAAELKSLPARIADPGNAALIRAARDHRLRGRVLFIDATTPEPDQDSGSLRLTNLMRCFRELGYGVTFMAENHAHAGSYTRDLQNLGVEVVHEPWVGSNRAFFRQRGAEFDVVVISRHYVAAHFMPLVRQHSPRARLVFDTVDLHYLREQRLAELEGSLPLRRVAEQTRRSELAVINEADAVLVVSETEVEVLARDAPDALVHLLSNIHEVPGRRAGFKERKDLFFVGGYQHPPNVDAAQWFVNCIWPLIHAELPEARFHLVGSKAPESVRALKGEGVVFHGHVEDLEHYLDHCRLAVAPLRYGAGVKGKVNMSMSHGQPVVATPMAIEGIGAQHGRDVLVADSEQAFAEEVVRLYRDEALWNRISDAAIANVERHFSLRAARASLEALLRRLHGLQD